jgi:hypothetical protein
VLAALIREEVATIREEGPWLQEKRRQAEGRAELKAISENYEDVKEHCSDQGWVEEPKIEDDEEGGE